MDFNALNIVNAINGSINKVYSTNLPAVNSANFSDMASQLRLAPQPVVNAWQDGLVNVNIKQILKNKRTYESPFRQLFQSPVEGENLQLQMIGLIGARSFSPDADVDGFFEDAKLDIAAQYISSVLKRHYDVSVNDDTFFAAFTTPENFMEFNNGISAQLYNSMEYGNTLCVKELISRNIAEGNIYLIPTDKVVDQATALEFTAKLKAVASDMAVEPSSEYNLSGFETWTPKDEGVVITDTDTQAVTETYSLAWAFNKSLLELSQGGQAITMKANSLAGGDVFALYADRYAFELRDKVGFPKAVSQYFGNTLSLKRWLHVQTIYAISFFNNIAGFADTTKIDDSAVAVLGLRSGSTAMNKGASDRVYVSQLTITNGKIFDKFGNYSVSGNTSDNTMIDTKSGKIVIGKDEVGSDVTGLTGKYVTVTWTSHLDSNITATINIKINS